MIVELALTVVATILKVVLFLPSLPDMPEVLSNAGDWFLSSVQSSVGIIKYIVFPEFFNAIMFLLIAYILFEQIYHFVIWLIRRVAILFVMSKL